jgi:mitogen-activated protein kinase organizer 1
VQTIHISPTTITTGSVDGHVRVYDLRKGELRTDFLGRKSPNYSVLHALSTRLNTPTLYRPRHGRRADPRWTNSPCDNVRLDAPSDGHDYGQDAQCLHGSHQRCLPLPRMFGPRRGQHCLRRRERRSVGVGPPGRAFGLFPFCFLAEADDCPCTPKAKLLQPNPPPKVHEKVITWTEHHPTDASEMVTASADGTVKVWRHPDSET